MGGSPAFTSITSGPVMDIARFELKYSAQIIGLSEFPLLHAMSSIGIRAKKIRYFVMGGGILFFINPPFADLILA